MDHRLELVHSLLVLVAAWAAKGQPDHENKLGSYESWSEVIGGILEVAGIPGFLGNLNELYETADAEGRMWREFTDVWFAEFQAKAVTPTQLNTLCNERDLMGSVRGGGNGRSQLTKLGLALDGATDRVFGQYRVRRVADKGPHKGRQYGLELTAPAPGDPSRAGDIGSEGPPTESGSDPSSCGDALVSSCGRPPESPPVESESISKGYHGEGDVGGPLREPDVKERTELQHLGTGTASKVPEVPSDEENVAGLAAFSGGRRSPNGPQDSGPS